VTGGAGRPASRRRGAGQGSRRARRRRAGAPPGRRAEAARDRALNALGKILGSEAGDLMLEEARPYRQLLTVEGLREAGELIRALEDDPLAEVHLVYGHLSLSKLQLDAGRVREAAGTGRKALALAEALDARRRSERSRSLVAESLHRLGGLPAAPADTRGFARRSNALFESLDAERY
jgi:hypothetical protein